MIHHHPDDNLLTEYASGSLAWALSLSVAAHMQLCPRCRQKVVTLNTLGGALLTSAVSEPVAADSFANLMARIHSGATSDNKTPKKIRPDHELHAAYKHEPMLNRLPKVVAKLLPPNGKLKWQRVSSALKTVHLVAGQNEYEVAFHCIRSGGTVVEHDHRGLEVTLVLHGSFSDENGVYSEGDFLVRHPGEVHRPTATLNQDCLCLSVVAAPVKVTGLLGVFINPFLSVNPA